MGKRKEKPQEKPTRPAGYAQMQFRYYKFVRAEQAMETDMQLCALLEVFKAVKRMDWECLALRGFINPSFLTQFCCHLESAIGRLTEVRRQQIADVRNYRRKSHLPFGPKPGSELDSLRKARW